MPNGFFHLYQLNDLFSIIGLIGDIFLILIKILKETNNGEPDQAPHFAASDLDLHCLPMSHKMNARLI